MFNFMFVKNKLFRMNATTGEAWFLNEDTNIWTPTNEFAPTVEGA